MKTILVTGGTGLVGQALKSVSSRYNHYRFIFLSSKDCDLTQFDSTLEYFKNTKPDCVIHLAACVGGLFKNMNNKVDMLEKNLLINLNVLKCCHLTNVDKCISCLSTCIFPDDTPYPINEQMLHNGPPHHSNDSYAYSKRILEIHSKAYREQYGRHFTCVIPTNIYGPHDNFSLENGHVIPSLIHRCYLAQRDDTPFIVKGTGTPLRQFIYSKDLATLLLWTLEEYQDSESLILSVPEKDEVSILDIVNTIVKEFKFSGKVIYDHNYSDGQHKKTADNSKLTNLIGEYEFVPIDQGIRQTVQWFKNNYNTCRK